MIFLNQSYRITRWDPELDLEEICDGARICYQAEDLSSDEKKKAFIRRLRDEGHHSPLEHSSLSVRFCTNRGITHELVRHRLTSPNQESTRYCNYSKGKFDHNVRFILDTSVPQEDLNDWYEDCRLCEERYFNRLAKGYTPDRARGALNNDVKADIKITANYREWRHIFKLRCDDKHAHYQMVELMKPLFEEVKQEMPYIFDDIDY